jgi:hypothetical protein
MECNEFRRLLDAYLGDSLDEDRRTEFRRHLVECKSCGGWARGEDPSLIFAAAGAGTVDMARVEACVTSVTSQIRQQRLAGRLRARRRPWLAAAAAALLVFGAAAIWQLSPGGVDQTPVAGVSSTVDEEGQAPPPTVEVEMPGDDVRVYQFANDDSDTAVYFIVNPALEL